MTYFKEKDHKRQKLGSMSFSDKAKALLFGVSFGKPKANKLKPNHYFMTQIKGYQNHTLNLWRFAPERKKQALFFHGYIGEKTDLLEEAQEYEKLGYGVTLVDFFGSGESNGDFTTIGFYESVDVHAAIKMIRTENPKAHIELYGSSMGAAAIIKAEHNRPLKAQRFIFELPFASMEGTVCNRFKLLGAPCFPGSTVLTWWGGVIHGFDALNYKPSELAKTITTPTIILAADKDQRAPLKDSQEILKNINAPKKLIVFKGARHQSLWRFDTKKWKQSIQSRL